MKKIIYLIMGILLLSSVYAERSFRISHYEKDGEIIINNIALIEDNKYYPDYGVEPTYVDDFWFQAFDEEGNILIQNPRELPPYTTISYTDELLNMKKITLSNKRGTLVEIDVNLCNYNGLCEPCLEYPCDSFENELSCGDCSPSTEDGFCNIADDGICDPDCKGYEYDVPPEYNFCYEDMIYHAGCEFFELISCEDGYFCNGIEKVLENSGETCCLGGCELLNYGATETPIEIEEPPEKQDYLPQIMATLIFLSVVILIIIRIKGQKTK